MRMEVAAMARRKLIFTLESIKLTGNGLSGALGTRAGHLFIDKLAQLTPDRRKAAESHIDWLMAEQEKERD